MTLWHFIIVTQQVAVNIFILITYCYIIIYTDTHSYILTALMA